MKHKGITLSSESEQECDGAHACPPGRLKSVDISDYKLFEEEQRTTQIIYSYKGGKKVPKLREPRNLFAFNEERKLQAPRWPGEMKVLNIRPRFIEYTPKEPEPFCKQGKACSGYYS
ncbi:cytosolic carboxypeptidase 3-like [Exaiptasia diaphana]|uniref:Uncharacterized protein n=1 Tax=Exaiptasia diaphana TaxID=2652724 RepID=A0A913YEK3_EXADI|nr:cytosolic carboxypeptidase 3-like [Exaiptasia diaphana]